MNVITLYFDSRNREFYDPYKVGVNDLVYGITLLPMNVYRVRLAVTKGRARIDTNGIPLAAYRESLLDQTSAVFTLKTPEEYAKGADGALTVGVSGYDTTDTAWHRVESCCVTLAPFLMDTTTEPGANIPEIQLLTSGSVRTTLAAENWSFFIADVVRPVFYGTEPSAPSGSTSPSVFDGTVLAGSDSVAITVSGMTTGGSAVPYFPGVPVSTIGAACSTNTVTVTLGGPVSTNTAVKIIVEKLA